MWREADAIASAWQLVVPTEIIGAHVVSHNAICTSTTTPLDLVHGLTKTRRVCGMSDSRGCSVFCPVLAYSTMCGLVFSVAA